MSTELTITPTTLVAVSGQQYDAARGTLLDWLRAKIAQVSHEMSEVDQAEQAARARDFRPGTYQRMRKRLEGSRAWYEKLVAGIEAGYTLMPDLPMRLFAIRTNKAVPKKNDDVVRGQDKEWSTNWNQLEGQSLSVGEGEYVSSTAKREATDSWTEQQKDGTTVGITRFENVGHQDVALPMALMKPELVEAVGRAMAEKIFDEIGICVPPKFTKGDPLVLGRIYRDSQRRKAVCFVIGWYVQVRDLV